MTEMLVWGRGGVVAISVGCDDMVDTRGSYILYMETNNIMELHHSHYHRILAITLLKNYREA